MSKGTNIKPLADLFTVVIGISLTIALQNAIDATNHFPLKQAVAPALVAFLFTVLPFAHGAVLHLTTAYDYTSNKKPNSLSLIVDYFILFLNGCLFIGWASLLPNTEYATYAYMCILVLDAGWGLLAKIFSNKQANSTPSLTWAVINVITFVLIFIPAKLFIGTIYKAGWDLNVSEVIAIVAVLRTVLDYSLTWRFYVQA